MPLKIHNLTRSISIEKYNSKLSTINDNNGKNCPCYFFSQTQNICSKNKIKFSIFIQKIQTFT